MASNSIVPVERELYAAILKGRPTVVPQEDASEAHVKPPFDAIVPEIRKAGLRLTGAAPSFMVMFMTRPVTARMRLSSSGASSMSLLGFDH